VASARFFVGTSGWSYDDWAGPFYPKAVKAADRLAFYTERFDAVELNASFYRTPTQPMIDAWNRRLPERFHLVAKGPRTITHLKKLVDCREVLAAFADRMRRVRALRAILWQLPPSLAKDVPRLEAFLAELPGDFRHAVEFRHPSWWDDEVAETLRRHDAAFAAVSHPRLPDAVRPTTDFLYVRFHGLGEQLYRYDYSREELAAWVDRLRPHLGGRTLYAFFNNTDRANAPRNAALMRELVGQA
jgi:uncharacterized protein YecE (DUF72 family)